MLTFFPSTIRAPVMPVLPRSMMAQNIMNEPEHYMICRGCHSVLNRHLILVCPLCHAYSHDYRIEYIMEMAKVLGQRK